LWLVARIKQKPTAVASRGFLSKFNLTTTSANGVGNDDDDNRQSDCLFDVLQHCTSSLTSGRWGSSPVFGQFQAIFCSAAALTFAGVEVTRL
jgi:hypothetical protein